MPTSEQVKQPARKAGSRKVFFRAAIFIIIILLAGFLAFKLTPWPSALLIRYAFNKEAVKVNAALQKYVPAGISALLNQRYDPGDKDALLDIYFPAGIAPAERLPVIVWVHGGGWVSGNKRQIANYCKILAHRGYIVASIDYSIAPEQHYPTPVRQCNAALAYLLKAAGRFHIDTLQFILAGDSGGAHIAAQTGAVISDMHYAGLVGVHAGIPRTCLSGLLLYCGAYDAAEIDLNGSFGPFLKTVLWSYSGKRNFMDDPYFKTGSVIHYLSEHFPPSFISAGNADPLLPQSQSFARKLAMLGVRVDTLFFAPGYHPSLPHEYQFNLDTDAGKAALERSVRFLQSITTPESSGENTQAQVRARQGISFPPFK